MDRRTFMGAVASGVLAAPIGAQQARKADRVGYIGTNREFALGKAIYQAFLDGMRRFGFDEARIWPSNFDRSSRHRLPSLQTWPSWSVRTWM